MSVPDDTIGQQTPAAPRLASFAVPPRFAAATFESYHPDPRYHSQHDARERLRRAVCQAPAPANGLLRLLRRGQPAAGWRGLYLDGGFGVGKTHLLAAACHAWPATKAYLSFQELTYVVGALGMRRALDLFGAARLICLDEFELDDPGNTMLATSFVRGVLERGACIIVTSNTLPSELGQGRFSADAFAREIGELAAAFESVRIEGEDYRQRRFAPDACLPRLLPAAAADPRATAWDALLARLAALHPMHYGELAAEVDDLALRDVAPIPDQDAALRFVHLIDKLYDRCRPLLLYSDAAPDDLFPPSYGYGGFKRKFRRCQSRLHEMLSEPLGTTLSGGSDARVGGSR